MRQWWSGNPAVEPFMLPVRDAIARHLPDGAAQVDIYNRAYEAVHAALQSLESPRSDWTPCAEGLPEETGKYWVTFFYYGAAFTEKRDYYAYENRWGQGVTPVAWMRTEDKPAPYNPDRTLAALGANADQKED